MGLLSFLGIGKKTAPQAATIPQNGYEGAATFSRDRSTLWVSSPEQTINPPAPTRNTMLATTRYLVNNFPLCERILSVSEQYAIGGGIIANAATSDNDFNERATAAFDKWASSPFCSSNNQATLYQMQRLIVRELLQAGECFIVLIKTQQGYPQIMLASSEQVRHSGEQSDSSVDGLYVDAFGKVTAYNIFLGETHIVVPASDVIHLLRQRHIGQLRGISPFAASLNSARDIKDIIQLTKKAVKTHSGLAVAVTRKSAQAGNGMYGELAPVVNSAGTSTQGVEQAFAGANVILAEGENVELLSSDRPSENLTNFVELLTRDVCLNLSIPFEFVYSAEKLTGTAVRFALADFSFYCQNIQTLLCDGFLQRLYSWVIASFIKDGRLAPPVNAEPWAVSWGLPISITVDQGRVTNAEISLLQNSLLTYDSFWSARGKNYKDELRQRAKEEQFLNELAAEMNIDVNRLRTLAAGSPSIVDDKEEAAKAA